VSEDSTTEVLAAAVRNINAQPTLDETMQEIARVTLDSVPGIDHVGISTMDRRGTPRTRAATSELVRDLDDLQHALDEGPAVDTLRGTEVVEAPRISQDSRWPRYVAAAVPLGLRSQIAVKLYIDQDGTVGGLNLYSTISDDLETDAVHIADALATYAALVMGKTREIDNLREGLRAREQIGMAVGVVMAKQNIDSAAAFAYLVQAAADGDVKVRVVAQQVLEQEESERRQRDER
jgi:hypothetical protein